MDRRIEKTKKAIFDALLSLMKEKKFEKVTINEIANIANVNRGTIYFHYLDKYDLLRKFIDSHLENIFVDCNSDTPKNLMLKTFNYLYENKDIFIVLLNEKENSFFRNRLLEATLESLEIQNKLNNKITSKSQNEFKNYFFASAFVGIVEWWINNSMVHEPEFMVDNFNALLKDIKGE